MTSPGRIESSLGEAIEELGRALGIADPATDPDIASGDLDAIQIRLAEATARDIADRASLREDSAGREFLAYTAGLIIRLAEICRRRQDLRVAETTVLQSEVDRLTLEATTRPVADPSVQALLAQAWRGQALCQIALRKNSSEGASILVGAAERRARVAEAEVARLRRDVVVLQASAARARSIFDSVPPTRGQVARIADDLETAAIRCARCGAVMLEDGCPSCTIADDPRGEVDGAQATDASFLLECDDCSAELALEVAPGDPETTTVRCATCGSAMREDGCEGCEGGLIEAAGLTAARFLGWQVGVIGGDSHQRCPSCALPASEWDSTAEISLSWPACPRCGSRVCRRPSGNGVECSDPECGYAFGYRFPALPAGP